VEGKPICIGVSAGNAADDRFGARLIASLRRHRPELRFVGVAGPNMRAQGVEPCGDIETLFESERSAARGRRRLLRGARLRSVQELLAAQPALFVGVGAPEFNLEIARQLRRAHVPTVEYAGPPVWNWRTWRIRRIAPRLSHVLARFPCEGDAYARAGVAATFIGHPLAESVPLNVDKAAARTQLRLPQGKLIVALLPGDHEVEFQAIAEIFAKVAHRFLGECSDVRFVVPATSRRNRELFESALRLHADGELPVTLLFGHAHEALAAADLALVANEEAALEAILLKTPMVIAVRAVTMARWWSRPLSQVPYVGLPNLLAGEQVVPVFLQGQATPWALAAALTLLQRDADGRRRQIDRFEDIHRTLRQDCVTRASEAILGLLENAAA